LANIGVQVCETCHRERPYADIRDLHQDGSVATCVRCLDSAYRCPKCNSRNVQIGYFTEDLALYDAWDEYEDTEVDGERYFSYGKCVDCGYQSKKEAEWTNLDKEE